MLSDTSTDITPSYTFLPYPDSNPIVSDSTDQFLVLIIHNISRFEFDISADGFVELDGVTKLNACQLEDSNFKYPVYEFKIPVGGVVLLRGKDGRNSIGVWASTKTPEHDSQIGLAYDVNAAESAADIRNSFVGPNAWRGGQEYLVQSPLTNTFHKNAGNVDAHVSITPGVTTIAGVQLRDKDSVSESLYGPLEYPPIATSTLASDVVIYNDTNTDFYCVLEYKDPASKIWLIFAYSSIVTLEGLLPFGVTWSVLAAGWGIVVSLLATIDPGRPSTNTFARFVPRGAYLRKTAGYYSVALRMVKCEVTPEGVLTTSETGVMNDLTSAINNLSKWDKASNWSRIGLPILLQKPTRGLETLMVLKMRNMIPSDSSGTAETYPNVFTFIEKRARNELLLFQPTVGGKDQPGVFRSFNLTGSTTFDGNLNGYTVLLLSTLRLPGQPRIIYRQDGYMGLLLENYKILGGQLEGSDRRTVFSVDIGPFIDYFQNPNPTSSKAGISDPSGIVKTVFHFEKNISKTTYTRWSMTASTRITPDNKSNIIIGIDYSPKLNGETLKDNSVLAVQKIIPG